MTAQVSETLIINGRERSMDYCPPLPPDKSLLIPTTVKFFEDKISDNETYHRVMEYWTTPDGVSHEEEVSCTPYSTGCWRDYIGTWELTDGKLYLTRLEGCYRLAVPGPLFADWVTGVLRLKLGRELCYVHMGFGSVTEKELHIRIDAGNATAKRILDNRRREFDWVKLGYANMPGRENRFPGDTEI